MTITKLREYVHRLHWYWPVFAFRGAGEVNCLLRLAWVDITVLLRDAKTHHHHHRRLPCTLSLFEVDKRLKSHSSLVGLLKTFSKRPQILKIPIGIFYLSAIHSKFELHSAEKNVDWCFNLFLFDWIRSIERKVFILWVNCSILKLDEEMSRQKALKANI